VSGMSLCDSCKHALVAEGERETDRLVVCRVLDHGARIRFAVRRCNTYARATDPEIYDLEAIAWHVTVDRKTRELGFISPAERARGNRSRIVDGD
jgi:hypothetical protein